MTHIKKILLIILTIFTVSVVGIFFIACDKEDITSTTKTLESPAEVRMEGNNLCWNPVEYASKYTVSIDNKEYYCEDTMYPLPTMTDGTHVFKVKANGDGVLYESSAWSASLSVTFEEGGTTQNDYYGQFDELTKKESFLGYGFDVINSAVFSDKYVKTSFPIFKTDELMNQRLLKVDSKQSYVEEVQSKDMETFMASWNANANVNVSWGGKRVGGSVDVSAKYSGGVENAKSKYFHVISFYNQKFYIVLQSDLNTYKTIVSDSFKQDLYSDMEPATFFDRYGTHFITSAVMGGKINSYYLYSSEEEKSYHDISGKVSTEVRAFKTGVNVDVSGGYKNEASSQNIFIKNTLEVIGGGDFGMLSDADIPANYKDWEKSLDEHASLMGIKDTGSLIPLWELIDSSLDTRTYSWEDDNGQVVSGNRSEQLQAYFMRYGMDEYNELMKSAGLPEIIVPESIENVRINGVLESDGEFEVYAGTDNDIAFSVLPEQAVGYTKNASLTSTSDYARIINNNGLKLQIDANIPRDIKVYNLVLSAGSVRKQISVRVIKTYTVDFNSSPGTSVPSLRNVKDGDRILEPTPPVLEDYEFKGWYTSDNFEENTKFDFITDTIKDNLTLYARWAVYFPKIRFVHEVPGCELVEDAVRSGTSYAQPGTPTIEGYTFGGWYSDIEMVTPFDFTRIIKKDTYIYVKWYKNPTITFVHSVDGCTMLNDSVVYNGVYSQPIMPEVEGYSFGGYYANKEMTQAYDFTKNITKDQTIYVKWNKDVTVKFISSVDSSVIYQTTVKYNTAVSELTQDPLIEGYNFNGYYKDESCMQSFDFSSLLTKNTEIYVKYDIKYFTVKFVTNGGSAVKNQTVAYKSLIEKPTTTKTGATLDGWYTDSACTKFFNFNIDVITDNITLYAKWGENLYTVTFNVNGGTAIDPVNVTYNTAIGNKLPTTAFKTGHTFKGWYLENSFRTEVTSATIITDSIIIYAKWEINKYTVTFNVNGGTAIDPVNVTYNTAIGNKLPTTAFKTGHTFKGWYLDSKFTNKADSQTVITDNITLYAKFSTKKYTIHYNINAPTYALAGEKTQSVSDTSWTYGANISYTTTKVEFTGYTFKGWALKSDSTTVFDIKTVDVNQFKNDMITLYAIWEIDPYTIGKANVVNNSVVSDNYNNRYVVYNNIYNTPQFKPEYLTSKVSEWKDVKIVVDWSGITNPTINYREAIANNITNQNGRINGNQDIMVGITDVYFIGNPNVIYQELYIFTVGYETNQELTIHFKNMHVQSACDQHEAIIDSWYGEEHKDVGMKLTLDFIGTNKFISVGTKGGSPIGMHKNVTITGEGSLEIKGSEDSVYRIARAGIDSDHLTLDYNGSLTIDSGISVSSLLVKNNISIDNLPQNANVIGWEFSGWYKESTFNTKISSGYKIEANTTIYSKWNVKTTASTGLYSRDIYIGINGYNEWYNLGLDRNALKSAGYTQIKINMIINGKFNGGDWFKADWYMEIYDFNRNKIYTKKDSHWNTSWGSRSYEFTVSIDAINNDGAILVRYDHEGDGADDWTLGTVEISVSSIK